MSSARFNGSDLSHANFTDTVLIDTEFKDAILIDVDFSRAGFLNTDLTQALIGETRFSNTDLSEVKGLETVRHYRPSSIGIDTIYSSKGKTPKAFLRGAGLPEEFINFALTVGEEPVSFHSCFVSHSSKDQESIEKIVNDLYTEGITCWYAPRDLRIGDRFRQQIHDSIRGHDKLLLALSESSICSTWVAEEVEEALELERTHGSEILFPIRLDDSIFRSNEAWAKLLRQQRHIGDFSDWRNPSSYQDSFLRLLRDLKINQ